MKGKRRVTATVPAFLPERTSSWIISSSSCSWPMVFPAAITGRPRSGGLMYPSSRTFSSCLGGALIIPEYVMVILFPGLSQSAPRELEEEAESDGAGTDTGVEPVGDATPAGSGPGKAY